MGNGGFSLSVSSRGNDFVIGGSGVLDVNGMASLRLALEESCKTEGAVVSLDLSAVSRLDPGVVNSLIEAGDFCRGLDVPFSVTVNVDVLAVLSAAGYGSELLPLVL